MKDRLRDLLQRLRAEGLQIAVAEAVDAAQAMATVGVARRPLADALAAALVKDARDRPLFDAAFDAAFPLRPRATPRRGRGPRRHAGEGDQGASGPGAGGRGGAGRRPPPSAPSGPPPPARSLGEQARRGSRTPLDRPAPTPRERGGALEARRRERALRALPFREMAPRDVEEVAALMAALARRFRARLRRRLRPRPRGRLDVRRTMRAAISRGGVPFDRCFRGRRRGTVRLVALCDLSASAATATGFFLGVLAPAARYFARVRLFGFVDRLVEIEFVDGQVRPDGPIDLMARSDFGRVLGDLEAAADALLGPDTLLLILGDARNNRRPPRADRLARARARCRRVLWLNPEPAARWDTGDSAMASYARHVDTLAACASVAELERVLIDLARL